MTTRIEPPQAINCLRLRKDFQDALVYPLAKAAAQEQPLQQVLVRLETGMTDWDAKTLVPFGANVELLIVEGIGHFCFSPSDDDEQLISFDAKKGDRVFLESEQDGSWTITPDEKQQALVFVTSGDWILKPDGCAGSKPEI